MRKSPASAARKSKKILVPAVTLIFCIVFAPHTLSREEDMEQVLAKGYKQLQINEKEKALQIFQEKARKYPTSGACQTAIGRALKKLGKISEAKDAFRRSCEVEPGFADGFYELGSVEESDKNWKAAAEAFTKYLQLKPDSAQRRTVEDRIRYCQDQG